MHGQRRSMGTKPSLVSAKRVIPQTRVSSSGTTPSTSRSSSANRNSGIPRFSNSKNKGASTTAESRQSRLPAPKRSISANPRSLAQSGGVGVGPGIGSYSASKNNVFATPRSRSQSANRTPQHRVLQTLNVNQGRYSMSNRGSAVGAAKITKDPRNLNDKSGQQKIIDEIIDFTIRNGHEIRREDFPLSSTNFKFLFSLAMQPLIPGWEYPKQKAELELPALLKKLQYPFTVSKSTFQTLGTSHSFPVALGVLHYIVDSANVLQKDDIESVMFPSYDEAGFVADDLSDDNIIFNWMVSCFQQFNNGVEDFGPEYKKLKREFMRKYQIDEKSFKQLSDKIKRSEEILGDLRRVSNSLEVKENELGGVKNDLAKYKAYLEKKIEHLKVKEKQRDDADVKLDQVVSNNKAIKARIIQLEEECREKGIPLDGIMVDNQGQNLRSQIASVKNYIDELEKKRYDKQIALTKTKDKINKVIAEYNSKLLTLDLTTEQYDVLRLDVYSNPENIQNELHRLTMSQKDAERSAKQRRVEMEEVIDGMNLSLKTMTKEIEQLKSLVIEAKEEKKEMEKQVATEEASLDDQLEKLKASLMELNGHSVFNLDELKRKLDGKEEELKTLRKKHEIKEKYWQKRLPSAMAEADKFLEEAAADRNQLYYETKKLFQERTRGKEELWVELDEINDFFKSQEKKN